MSLFKPGPAVGERLRFSPWHGDAGTAYIAPTRAPRGPISRRDVVRCLADAAEAGFRRAVTAALSARDQDPFLDAGFFVAERLHLLVHPLDRVPTIRPTARLRAPRRRDRTAALAVDRTAFEPFWRLDEAGLRDALTATGSARFRVAGRPPVSGLPPSRPGRRVDADVVGYSICGYADGRGYLQRLAVDPTWQGGGVGTTLLVDALRWLRNRGARDTLVNTQHGNERSLRLYQRTGFVLQPEGLAVLCFDPTDVRALS